MRAKRTDSNHKEIVQALRAAGVSVMDTSAVGRGFPDLVIGWNGQNYLAEIKTAKGKPNDLQVNFFTTWQGQAILIREVTDIFNFLGLDRNEPEPFAYKRKSSIQRDV